MALETVIADGIAHAGAGVALSLLDFFTCKLTNPKSKRVQQKTQCLQAIETLLDAENPSETGAPAESGQQDVAEESPSETPQAPAGDDTAPETRLAKDSVEYAEQVGIVRDFLRTSALVKLELPLVARIKDGFKHLLVHEKINTLSNLAKLGVACGFEAVYDIIFDFQVQGATGIATSLYQIPAFFIGLWCGNGFKKFLNLFMSSSAERRIDKTIRQLLNETPIVGIVVKYVPSETLKEELANRGMQVYVSQLTRAGKGAYQQLQQIAETARDAAGDVMNFAQKQEDKQQQEREERRKRFDELTKDR